MGIEELRRKRKKTNNNSKKVIRNMEKITCESYRVANVASNAKELLQVLEEEFDTQTGLNKVDSAFLFLAIALQCTRIFVLNKITEVNKAGHKNRNEKLLHKLQKDILKKFEDGEINNAYNYKAPLNQIITNIGVPYDATRYLDQKFGIFKGANHRFATLGHDPVLGLVFGTSNILTNTITHYGNFRLETNHVVYDSVFKNPRIGEYGSTIVMLKKSTERVEEDKKSIVAALIKQVIHIGTDMYTPCGIQLPFSGLLLSKENVEIISKYLSTGDVIKIGASAGIAMFINMIISILHTLLYDDKKYSSRDIYAVKTRKIIMYSNLIASSSNIILGAANVEAGNIKVIKDLDIGGVIITINRLLTDTEFIRSVKKEFVLGGFNEIIQGGNLNLEEIKLWE